MKIGFLLSDIDRIKYSGPEGLVGYSQIVKNELEENQQAA
jgi:hypothetical protein